ncbi:MAG: DUF3416 domain-containing protein, partial [Microcella sp.]|nr:DUF3416 domain-containing protein [Microcella sp.]
MATTQHSPFAHRIGRIPIRHLSPVQPENRWPSTAFVGEVVPFAATAFREGHDLIGADLVLTSPDREVTRHPMSPGAPGTDRWHADAQLEQAGDWQWWVEAYADDWATWLHAATVKIEAGVDVELMLLAGAQLLERAIALAGTAPAAAVLTDARAAMRRTTLTPAARLAVATDARVAGALAEHRPTSLLTQSEYLVLR